MLRRLLKQSLVTNHRILLRTVTQASENLQAKEKWDIFAGILVERLPVITKTLNPMEMEFQQLLQQVEFENSLKSDHELRHERDLKQAELLKKGELEVDLDDTISKQTAQDLKDAYIEEFKKFQLAPRITEADKKDDVKSTNRKLDSILYLLIEQKLGDKTQLIIPQGLRQEGETMRQTAERVLKERCGDNIDAVFYGNAPCGFYKYKYPASQRNTSVGAKIFFYRTTLKGGNVDAKLSKKFEWLDKENLQKKLKGSYSESIQSFLLE